MTPVSISPDLIARLVGKGDEIPLAGADGTPVGYFLSPEQYATMRKAFFDWAFAQFPPDQAARVFANPGRHTTAEVFKLLEGR